MFGFIFAGDRPMISANSWHISYLVNLSSDENWSVIGRLALSEVLIYLAAISARAVRGGAELSQCGKELKCELETQSLEGDVLSKELIP